MLPFLEHAAVGAALIAAAAFGLARAAVYFRSTESTGDRFFPTSLTSVVLVALAVSGAFFVGRAVFDADGIMGIVTAAAGLAYLILAPAAAWRWFGPRQTIAPDRTAA